MPSHLSVVVGWHLRHRTSQLGHLDLPLVIPLKATEQHFPLAWFQTWHTHIHRSTLVELRSNFSSRLLRTLHLTHHRPGRGLTSRYQSWSKAPAPCWQSRCRRGTWWTDHTSSPVKRPNVHVQFNRNKTKQKNIKLDNCRHVTSGRLCSLRWRLLIMKLVSHSLRSSTFFLLKA